MALSEFLIPHHRPAEEPEQPTGRPKTTVELYRFRGMFDREPHRVCWVRVFAED